MPKDSSTLVVTLRHNIGVESDVALARAELQALSESAGDFVEILNEREFHATLEALGVVEQPLRTMTHSLRKEGVLAFMVHGANAFNFENVVQKMAFAQDVLFQTKKPYTPSIPLMHKLTRTEPIAGGYLAWAVSLSSILDYSTKMVFNREKGMSVSVGLDALTDSLLDGVEPPRPFAAEVKAAITAKKTTLYLTHELHLYKGKFFPRMVRSLMNRYLHGKNAFVVDPFVGSGTTLLESSILGYPSLGIDVDPTSVLISESKLSPKDIEPAAMEDVCFGIAEAVRGKEKKDLFGAGTKYCLEGWEAHRIPAPEPMRGRLIKRGREEGYDLLGDIENDSAKALCLISQAPERFRTLLRVCLSHALTKKLRLRFVGIGNGRFTIDVAKVGVLDLFVKKAFHLVAITEVFAWLKRNGITFADSEVIRGSAKDFNTLLSGRKADLILTSPPYIPASSGREHYARARAIPLVFTGAARLEDLDQLDQAFIGEMSAQTDSLHLEESMPPSIRATLSFLRQDKQRLPKYMPTLNYYVDLERVLKSTLEALSPEGRALYVVGTSHTFYIHKTKEILHTVDAANSIAELGTRVGLEVEEVIHIPLKKSGGLNARPRSTDDYSESVVVFKRPLTK
jgi:hypothetical protein